MLELGGKSPQIVFEDAANLPNLGQALAQSAFYNSGQLCIAKSRLLVHETIKEQIVESLIAETSKAFCVGDPLDEDTNFGPLASDTQWQRVNHYIELGNEEGAHLREVKTVGKPSEKGIFYATGDI